MGFQVVQMKRFSATEAAEVKETINVEESSGTNYAKRFQTTVEVAISKIFPAGFGWQYSSCIADDMGFQATDAGFAAMTGLGDMCGVFTGHSIYYTMKSLIDPTVDVKTEVHTALFLGSAAFCSGAAWQPVVNTLQAANLPFNGVVVGTTAATGLAFFTGLRIFRSIYNPMGLNVPANDYANLKSDCSLSVSIGSACGAFVGTDIAYFPDQNWLKGAVGIEDADAVLTGCVKAGSSTALGFTAVQTAQNVAYAKGKNWTD